MMADHHHPIDNGYPPNPYMQQQGMPMQYPGNYPGQYSGYQQQPYGQPPQQYMHHDPNYNMGGHSQSGQQWMDSDL